MVTVEDYIPVMVDRIVRQFHPLRVILFGSRARGTARPDSDVDLLVVLSACENRRGTTVDILKTLRGIPIVTDVIVATPEEIAREGRLVGTVLRPALREGKVLYEQEKRGFPVSEPTPDAVAEVVRRWLRHAARDLQNARILMRDPETEPEGICWHAQQAAEKALKAVLIFLQMEYPYTHNLDAIRDLIPEGWHVKEEHPDLKRLSDWSIEARYPGPWPEATDEDARSALLQARAVWESVLQDLERHGFETEVRP